MDIPMLDKCPNYNLYISGFIALRRPKALQNCHITHIVSVLEWQFEQDNPLTRGFQHLHIPVDDVEDENLLVWFPRSNAFIHEGLNSRRKTQDAKSLSGLESKDKHPESGVLIHCAMGKSRSATVLIAYLLWDSCQSATDAPSTTGDPDMVSLPPKRLSVIGALTLLRQGRPIAEPNEGFMDQLYLYADMNCPSTQSELESHKLYRRWMNKRNVAESLRINQAPEMDDIKFEDESDDDDSTTEKLSHLSLFSSTNTTNPQEEISPGITAPKGTEAPSSQPNANSLASTTTSSNDLLIKCRRCRHLLARSNFILPHTPLHSDPLSKSQHPIPSLARIPTYIRPNSLSKQTLISTTLSVRAYFSPPFILDAQHPLYWGFKW